METPKTPEPRSTSKEVTNARTIESYTTLTLPEWQNILEESIPEFKGNRENAARILYELSQGARWTLKKYADKGLEIQNPGFAIVITDEFQDQGTAAYDPHTNHIFITIKALETAASIDPEIIQSYGTVLEPTGVFYKGTIPNLFRLLGVEEAHHAIYFQYKGKVEQKHPGTIVSYHTADNEFAALRARIRYAMENNMDPSTIDVMQNILKEARELRRLQG